VLLLNDGYAVVGGPSLRPQRTKGNRRRRWGTRQKPLGDFFDLGFGDSRRRDRRCIHHACPDCRRLGSRPAHDLELLPHDLELLSEHRLKRAAVRGGLRGRTRERGYRRGDLRRR